MDPSAVVLERPIWHALTGAHAHFGRQGRTESGAVRAVRYLPEIGPFGAVDDIGDPEAWAALGTLVEAGGTVVVMLPADPPAAHGDPWPSDDWKVAMDLPGVQMVADSTAADPMTPAAGPVAVPLGAQDVDQMRRLVARTRPGPFGRRTIELGGYVGIRSRGRLVAMAGRRFALRGYTEMSAVCTDPDERGRGLATTLVRAVATGVVADGDVPFLHASADNTNAIALYERLGMRVSRLVRFVALERVAAAPGDPAAVAPAAVAPADVASAAVAHLGGDEG